MRVGGHHSRRSWWPSISSATTVPYLGFADRLQKGDEQRLVHEFIHHAAHLVRPGYLLDVGRCTNGTPDRV